MRISKKSLWLLPVAVILFLGLTPDLIQIPRLLPTGRTGILALVIQIMLLAGGPLVLILGILRLRRWRMKSTLATLMIFALIVYGVVGSVLLASGAGVGSGNAILHGFALTFALTGMVAYMVQDPMHYWGGNLALVLLALSTGVALYSLAGIPATAYQAMRLADGNPYCLSVGPRNNDRLSNVSALRNFSLDYRLTRNLTGEVDLYPNHILVVQEPETRAFHYWSPTAFSFLPVTPDHPANGRLGRVCTPQQGFIWTLNPF